MLHGCYYPRRLLTRRRHLPRAPPACSQPRAYSPVTTLHCVAPQIQPICNYPGNDIRPATAAPAYLAAIHVPGNGSVYRVPSFCGVSSVPSSSPLRSTPPHVHYRRPLSSPCPLMVGTWDTPPKLKAGVAMRWRSSGGSGAARKWWSSGGGVPLGAGGSRGGQVLAEERGWPGRSDDNARRSTPSSAARFCGRHLRPSHSTSGGIEGSGGGV